MKLRRVKVRVSVDGWRAGVITVAANATERQKVLAAVRLPGVRSRLRSKGVQAARSGPGTYEIFSTLPSDLRALKAELARGRRPGRTGLKQNPYRGLSLPL